MVLSPLLLLLLGLGFTVGIDPYIREGNVRRITIQDNGVGFDPDQKADDQETHIGLQNVKDRIEQMCGGKMILQSEIGCGTSVTLLIPDSAKKEQGT